MKAGKVNPDYLTANYELSWITKDSVKVPTPYPYRYNDLKAAQRHLETGEVQPETITPWIVTE